MAFCATCGTAVEGRFCAKCGTPIAATAGAAPPPPSGAAYQPAAPAAGMADNVASALCYALGFITGIIFLVLAPYNQNRTVRFHAFQSIFFSVAVIVIRIALSIILSATLGFFTMLTVQSLISLCFFALWLYLLIATYQGKTVVLPVIGPLAQKQA
jgi:uncharacterized membrane protein